METETAWLRRSYKAGGARGETALAREGKAAVATPESSRGATASEVAAVCIATGMAQEPLEQTGQKCDAEEPAWKSAQKWNCPARNSTPRRSAINRIFGAGAGMFKITLRLGHRR